MMKWISFYQFNSYWNDKESPSEPQFYVPENVHIYIYIHELCILSELRMAHSISMLKFHSVLILS